MLTGGLTRNKIRYFTLKFDISVPQHRMNLHLDIVVSEGRYILDIVVPERRMGRPWRVSWRACRTGRLGDFIPDVLHRLSEKERAVRVERQVGQRLVEAVQRVSTRCGGRELRVICAGMHRHLRRQERARVYGLGAAALASQIAHGRKEEGDELVHARLHHQHRPLHSPG